MQVKKIAEDSFASENDYAEDNYNDDGGDYDEGSSFASDSDISNSFEEIHEILSRRNEKDKRDIESEDALLLVEFQSNRSCSQMSDMSVTRKDGTIPPIQFYNQKHSCFVSSIIQCLVSNPLLRKCLLSASFVIEPMKSIVKTVEEVINREKSPTLMRILAPDSFFPAMHAFDEASRDEYMFGGLGCPGQFLQYLLEEAEKHGDSETENSFFHLLSMALDLQTTYYCIDCGRQLPRVEHTYGGAHVGVRPSGTNDCDIQSLLETSLAVKNEITEGSGWYCDDCQKAVNEYKTETLFREWSGNVNARVLIVHVHPESGRVDGSSSLVQVHRDIDLTNFMAENKFGWQRRRFIGELTGCIQKCGGRDHYVAITRGLGGDGGFFRSDDLCPESPEYLGIKQNDRWGDMMYLFYTVRREDIFQTLNLSTNLSNSSPMDSNRTQCDDDQTIKACTQELSVFNSTWYVSPKMSYLGK